MSIWDGHPITPEDEREGAWVDPLDGLLPGEDAKAQERRADAWEVDYPGQDARGPMEQMFRDMLDDEDEEE